MHYLGSSRIRQNSIDLAEFGRNGRLWQIAVENSRLRQIAVKLVAGRSGKRWKQVGVYKVSRECPVTVGQILHKKRAYLSLCCFTYIPGPLRNPPYLHTRFYYTFITKVTVQ